MKADAAVAAIIHGRIHPATDPQQSPRPKITFQRISTSRRYANDGPLNSPAARIQIDCWADTLLVAKTLSEKVRRSLDGFRGTLGEYEVQGIHIDGESDNPGQLPEGRETRPQGVTLDFIVHYIEV